MATHKQIGKYEVLKELGTGSVGVVYKARDPNLNRTVAIKMLKSLSLGDLKQKENLAIKRFYQEAQLACMLRHSSIVTIFDAGISEIGTPYIVMEYIEGQDLGDLIDERGSLPLDEALRYLAPIAKAIDCAHTQGIIHRDIKPNNIMISKSGTPFLLDFSVAKLHDTSLTPAGTLLGTPEYMAPEQILADKFDHRVDYFALAVVLFEALTGQLPFLGKDIMGTATMIVKNPPKSFAELGCDLPEEIEDVLKRGLSKKPDDRYRTAEEFINNVIAAAKLNGALPSAGFIQKEASGETASALPKVEQPAPTESTDSSARNWKLGSGPFSSATNLAENAASSSRRTPSFSHDPLGQVEIVLEEDFEEQNGKRIGLLSAVVLFLCVALGVYGGLSYYKYQGQSSANGNEAPAQQGQQMIDVTFASDEDLSNFLKSPMGNTQLLRQAIPEAANRKNSNLVKLALNHAYSPDLLTKVEVLKIIVANPRINPSEATVDLIKPLVLDSDRVVRGFAVKALAAIGTKEAKAQLVQLQQREMDPVVLGVLREELSRLK